MPTPEAEKLIDEFEVWCRNHARRECREVRLDEMSDWWLERAIPKADIKNFISQALQQERERIWGEILNNKPYTNNGVTNFDYNDKEAVGYLKCINDTKDIIFKKK
jgi:hypothetical protein